MEDNLIELLETMGVDVFRQGSLTEDDPYPDLFITFWNNDEISESHYDNCEVNAIYTYDVNVYGVDSNAVYTMLNRIRTLLKENGYVTPSRAHDVASDEKTHIGRGLTVAIAKYF